MKLKPTGADRMEGAVVKEQMRSTLRALTFSLALSVAAQGLSFDYHEAGLLNRVLVVPQSDQ